MILINQIITDIRIESVNDLYKLKPFLEDGTLKINKSQIARELEVDRRTVDKYINGYTKPETRNCDDCITPFYDIITELLSDKNQQVFYYRKVLWQYLVDNHGFKGVYCNFCHYLRKYPEFDSYFRKSRPSNTNKVTVRYETPMGKQAQLDWKESIPFILSSGEIIEVNIFVLLLSYSRFRVYRVSLSKTQDILFSFLDDAFETLGGIPDEIVTDNMKTVMDEARTEYYAGKVNNKFQQFADDYGFKVQPCISGHPHTKAKVEAPMKILDEIRAYNGKLNYIELVELVTRINNRVNTQVNQSVPNNYLSLNLHLGHQHCELALYSLYPASAISLVILLAFCNFTCFEKWNSSLSRTLISTVRHRKPFSRSLAATLSAKML